MAEDTFRCTLVTPTEKLLDDQVVYASVPAWDGLFGVLSTRAPLVAKLGLGVLRLDFPPGEGHSGGGERQFLIESGFAKMADGKLTILAEHAMAGEEFTVTDSEAELKEAEARVVPLDSENRDEDMARITRDRDRARLKLRIAQSNQTRGF